MNFTVGNVLCYSAKGNASSLENLLTDEKTASEMKVKKRELTMIQTSRCRSRLRSLSLTLKGEATGEHVIMKGDEYSDGKMETDHKPKRARATSSATITPGCAFRKLKKLNFREMGDKWSRSAWQSKAKWNLEQFCSRIMGTSSCNANRFTASDAKEDSIENPFKTPLLPTPTHLIQQDSEGSIPVLFSELINDPELRRKKEKRTIEKIEQLLGDEASAAAIINVRMGWIGRLEGEV